MDIKKELIKAGFEDQADLTEAYGDALEFELSCKIPLKPDWKSTGSIRVQKLKNHDEVEITIFSDSGYEILIGMVGNDDI